MRKQTFLQPARAAEATLEQWSYKCSSQVSLTSDFGIGVCTWTSFWAFLIWKSEMHQNPKLSPLMNYLE